MGGLIFLCFSWLWTVRYLWYDSQWWFPVAWVSVHHYINNCTGSLSKSFTLCNWNTRESWFSDLLLLPSLHCISNLSVFSIVLSPVFFLVFITLCHVPGSSLQSVLNQYFSQGTISPRLNLKKPKKAFIFILLSCVKCVWIYMNSTVDLSRTRTAVYFSHIYLYFKYAIKHNCVSSSHPEILGILGLRWTVSLMNSEYTYSPSSFAGFLFALFQLEK